MADDEDGMVFCFAAVGPVDGGKQVVDAVARAEAQVGFEGKVERLSGLLAALGGAGDDAQVFRNVRLEPSGHLLRLFFAARGEFALDVGDAVFGFGVAPEQEVHELSFPGAGFRRVTRSNIFLPELEPVVSWSYAVSTGPGYRAIVASSVSKYVPSTVACATNSLSNGSLWIGGRASMATACSLRMGNST